ncbi:hypothetical protein QF026_000116 [Streptomyces aurantiacus]|nr:hypothetical protein [Streptomyces aurantiacus]
MATRYDKLAVRYEATVLVAAIDEWLSPQLTPCPLRGGRQLMNRSRNPERYGV